MTVGLKNRNLAELGEEGAPDAVHLRVMPNARVVVLGQRRREDVTRPVQVIFELAEHEVAVDGIGILLEKAPKFADLAASASAGSRCSHDKSYESSSASVSSASVRPVRIDPASAAGGGGTTVATPKSAGS